MCATAAKVPLMMTSGEREREREGGRERERVSECVCVCVCVYEAANAPETKLCSVSCLAPHSNP